MDSSPAMDGDRSSALADVLLALFLALPALVLGWPGELGPLHGVFAATEWTATGFAVLLALPLAALLLWRRAQGPEITTAGVALLALLVTLSWALCRPSFSAISDPVERTRAFSALLLLALFFAGAMRLELRGRRALVWGSCLVTCVLLTPALWSGMSASGGALGNSGELSGAALPGALVGAFAALHSSTRAATRFAFLLPPALFVLHAAIAPSYVGAIAFTLVLAFGAIADRSGGSRRRLLALGAILTAACVLTFALSRRTAPETTSFQELSQPTADESATSPDDSLELGGFSVRMMIWQSSLRMIAAHPFIGHGPGQFSVHFPPHRDLREIEASSYGREAGVETEVEHPHQDVLVVASELGLFGLLPWLLFLGAASICCVRSLRRGTVESAFAAGGLGLLLHAMANATLTANPAAATIGAACLGAGVRLAPGPETKLARGLPLLFAILLLSVLPQSWNAARHGRAIARLAHGNPSANTQLDAWEDAVKALPESSVALSARARLAEALKQRPESIERLWRRVLEIRPHRVEALIQLGVGRGRSGDVLQACEYFEHAHELDPAHPVATQNLTRVLFLLGRSEEGESLLEGLAEYENRSPSSGWLRALAVDVLARCDIAGATALYGRAEAADELRDLQSGDYAWARSGLLKAEGRGDDADAWATHAHRLWAAEHLAGGRASDAVRSYRQAVRIARDVVPPEGPPVLLREFAEALDEAGRPDEARQVLDRIAPN